MCLPNGCKQASVELQQTEPKESTRVQFDQQSCTGYYRTGGSDMGELRPWHLIILLVVIFVLFGYKKLPDATRSLGRSLRILKTEVKSLHDDDADKPATPEAAAAEAKVPVVPLAVEAPVRAPRVVEAPRASVPEASVPVTPVTTGAPQAPAPDSDQR
jgi:sec-independent protein translocase protein TatA